MWTARLTASKSNPRDAVKKSIAVLNKNQHIQIPGGANDSPCDRRPATDQRVQNAEFLQEFMDEAKIVERGSNARHGAGRATAKDD